ncbi:hypothetical protein STBA_03050 [Streptomyces sp. MP131-18]|nr:hypothetical protein STBA_03050 [Streptomyces sp. MP131-18]
MLAGSLVREAGVAQVVSAGVWRPDSVLHEADLNGRRLSVSSVSSVSRYGVLTTELPPPGAQLPKKYRRGRQTLIRTDSGGGPHAFVAWLPKRGRWLSYSVGPRLGLDAGHRTRRRDPGRLLGRRDRRRCTQGLAEGMRLPNVAAVGGAWQWSPGLVLNAVVLWSSRCIDAAVAQSRAGEPRTPG